MTQATLAPLPSHLDAPITISTPVAAPRDLTPTELLGVAHGLAVQQDLWHPHVRHDPLQRTYHEVARTDRYSAWLICWMPGHDTGFHDHDGSGGVGLVLRGQVTESRLRLGGPDGTRKESLVERACGRGQHFSFDRDDIHRVHHSGDEPAVTLHVYSPVLTRMGSYELVSDGSVRRHMLDESQELRPTRA